MLLVIIKGEKNPFWKVVTIGGSNGGHDFSGFLVFSSNKVPPRGLWDEGEDDEEVEEGGEGGGDIEIAPRGENVGNAGEEGNAGGEEVEGGHASGAAEIGTHGFGGEDESAEADTSGAAASEEAEEDIEPVAGSEGC